MRGRSKQKDTLQRVADTAAASSHESLIETAKRLEALAAELKAMAARVEEIAS